MRAIFAVTTAALVWSAGAQAGPATVKTNIFSPIAHSVSLSASSVEQKAEHAVQAQKVLDKKFDDQVRKATVSICAGCLQEARPRLTNRVGRRPERLGAAVR